MVQKPSGESLKKAASEAQSKALFALLFLPMIGNQR
jgi:hypothetical protein